MAASEDLLFEIGCEELPPGALVPMAEALVQSMTEQLVQAELGYASARYYATPRRLACVITRIPTQQPDSLVEKFGPTCQLAYDADNQPTRAATGFARSCGVNVEALEIAETAKGPRLVYREKRQGAATATLLTAMLQTALQKLPVPRLMRWGEHPHQFVRPVHWVLLLYGSKPLPADFYGVGSDSYTWGHRFEAPRAIAINAPEDYEKVLEHRGRVIAEVSRRQESIRRQLEKQAHCYNCRVSIDEALLEEVTALVEYPVVYWCHFDRAFLRVPAEALVMAMQSHQKCFPVRDQHNRLVNAFMVVANIESQDAEQLITGNERVMAARLADAAFFYDADIAVGLNGYNPRLAAVVFQQQLGSIQDKVARTRTLASAIAEQLGMDARAATRAAELAKADLNSEMVFEFPELQGIIGEYYALAQGEKAEVARALPEQYYPRYAGDRLPESDTGTVLALADKLDTLAGIFGIGQKPSGDKDPFALRRAMIGVLRILREKHLAVNFESLLALAIETYGSVLQSNPLEQLLVFAFERLKQIYRDQGVPAGVFEAVYACRPPSIADFDARVMAVAAFGASPEAQTLLQAYKRVTHLLARHAVRAESNEVAPQYFCDPAETTLYQYTRSCARAVSEAAGQADYHRALTLLQQLSTPLSDFFDQVMVISDDETLRHNRLCLLREIQQLFRQVADLSCLNI